MSDSREAMKREATKAEIDVAREWLKHNWPLIGNFDFEPDEQVYTTVGRVAELMALYKAEEREQSCKDVCQNCANGLPVKSSSQWIWMHEVPGIGIGPCLAAAIRSRVAAQSTEKRLRDTDACPKCGVQVSLCRERGGHAMDVAAQGEPK